MFEKLVEYIIMLVYICNFFQELDFPKEYNDETLIVKETSQLNSDTANKICEEFAEDDDDDSVIFPSAMVMTDGYSIDESIFLMLSV